MKGPLQRRQVDPLPGAGGFALLVLLGIVGIGSVGLLLAVQGFLPPLAGRIERIDADLGIVAQGARSTFAQSGAFPADLDALAAATGLPAGGGWRRDPWGAAQDYDLGRVGSNLRLRSRGPDRRLGTGDDVVVQLVGENLLRCRQRAKLRLLRALYARALQDAIDAMGPPAPTGLVDAVRRLASARRAWLTTSAADRVALTAQMATDAATITAAQAHVGWALPAALTGAGGLMEWLGKPDAIAVDGAGRALQLHASLGIVAVGSDRVGGTDDDM
jgi:hypothetical protein